MLFRLLVSSVTYKIYKLLLQQFIQVIFLLIYVFSLYLFIHIQIVLGVYKLYGNFGIISLELKGMYIII